MEGYERLRRRRYCSKPGEAQQELHSQILLGVPLSLEIRMLFSLGTGRATLTQGFYDLFQRRRMSKEEVKVTLLLLFEIFNMPRCHILGQGILSPIRIQILFPSKKSHNENLVQHSEQSHHHHFIMIIPSFTEKTYFTLGSIGNFILTLKALSDYLILSIKIYLLLLLIKQIC